MKGNKYLFWIVFVAVNGGLLFGLNMAGIAGANSMIQSQFSLGESQLGFVASSLMLGCLLGALFTGRYAERYGRKKVMVVTALLYILGAIGCALSNGFILLTLFRIISGCAVGAASVVVPMYVAEVSPVAKRGALVSLNQLAITIGILIAYVADYFLLDSGSNAWRYMLAVPAIFGLLFLFCLNILFPESPRWLLAKGRRDDAIIVLKKINGDRDIDKDLADIESAIAADKQQQKASFKQLFTGKIGRIVFIGTMIAVFQQITGINAVFIFVPDIFKGAGVAGDTALLQSILIGVVNILMTLLAVRLMDSLGRKTLLLWGAVGMTLSLAYLTYSFSQPDSSAIGILIALLAYIAFLAISFSPVMWVLLSEIYPGKVKGLAMSFSTAVSWACGFLVVYLAPTIRASWGDSTLFGIFCVFSLLAFLFVKLLVPETKGKSLEQIEREFGA